MSAWLKELRALVSNQFILDASQDKVLPVKTLIKKVSDLEKSIQRTKDQGKEVDACLTEYDLFEHQHMKEAMQELKKELKALARKA